ncbi:MAG: riboflavin biosynthesis protein RibF [Candidatus Omnitrophica bacterium]|nr:riboflavin biosynthesis protein RibF [Candidatus Omnitrophota bacterium]
MKVICGLNKIKKFPKPVVCLGVFDGMHLGHIRILKDAVKTARRINGTSIVVTFCPHPQKKESLYSLEHRLRLIAEQGVQVCIVINFTESFAKTLAYDFVKEIVHDKIGANFVYVGKNFRFGKHAAGSVNFLRKLSSEFNFKLKSFGVLNSDGKPISSTLIRNLNKSGKLSYAERVLGRPVSVLGTVVHGNSIARKLGYSTANINPHHEVIPPTGVYAVEAILEKERLRGICNIGVRPTFRKPGPIDDSAKHIEVHVFNFHRNIYGKYIEIQFFKKIREEVKFKNSSLLIKQIKKDINKVKSLFHLPKKHHNI